MTNITGSALPRLAMCPPSGRLRQIKSNGKWASHGQVVHAFLRRAKSVDRKTALAEIPEEHRRACASIDLERMPLDPEKFAAEVSYAYDIKTGRARFLGADLNREYKGLLSTEIPCTLDVVGIDRSTATAWVYDYKSGWGWMPPARDHWQLIFGLLCVTRAHDGVTGGHVEVLRTNDDGAGYHDWASFDEFDLAERAVGLQQLVKLVDDTSVQVYEGAWCKYCPAFQDCDAKVGLIREFLRNPQEVEKRLSALITPDMAAEAHRLIEGFCAAGGRMKALLEGYAKEHPFDLPDGQRFGPHPYTRIKPDTEKTIEFLTARFGKEVADMAVKKEAQVGLFEDAVKGRTDPVTGRKVNVQDLRREWVESGAARPVTTYPVSPYKP